MEIAALILGIIGLVGSTVGSIFGFGWVGSICGLIAIILGAIGAKKDTPNKGKAKVGLVLGIIALAYGIVATIVCAACIGAGAAAVGSMF